MEYCYSEGKIRALTFSYDDGEIYDRDLIGIFSTYGIKGTFHLNSGWIDRKGYITSEEIPELYKGHEVACHGVNHRYLRQINSLEALRELEDDRAALERFSSRIIQGYSYAFGEYSEEVISILKNIGIVYARTADTTGKFYAPADFLKWDPTCHHDEDVFGLLHMFMNPPDYLKMPLMYVYGHSFEFARNGNWDHIEKLCREASGDKDTWYATNMQIYRYFMAIKNLIFSVDGAKIYNNSPETVWFFDDKNELISLGSGELYQR